MKAVILAGGKGSRLKELTKNIPKPMLKIGGTPVLEHQINLFNRYGIKDIVILTNHLSQVIEDYFKDGKDFGVNISYFREHNPLGTAAGLKEIEDCLNEDFIVVYGDIMLDMDVVRFIDFHRNKKGICALALHSNDHPFDSDLVEIDNNCRITAFHPKPHEKNRYFRNLANACFYVMSPKILKYIEKGKGADFGKDILPKIIKTEALYGYNTSEYLKDIGAVERLSEVERDYSSGKVQMLNRNNKRKAVFLDRDGVINEEVGLIHQIDDFKLFADSAKAIKKLNDSGFLAIVVTNQPVAAKNLCSIDCLEEIHKKMETFLGKEGAKLDGIYYCPHHPDKGFPEENPEYKAECDCRKPKTGLIKKAQKDFNIDFNESYFIGDSFKDILCGRNAGLITIGVRTGKACRDGNIEPDYLFDNLYQAVNFIIKP